MSANAATLAARPNLISVLRHRNFALLWGGQTISRVGDSLFYIAQMWLVLNLTGSALAMGTTAILTMLPRLIFQLVGGVSVDRYDRRWLMILSDAVRGIVVLVFALLVSMNQIQMWHVYALSVVFGIVSAFFEPAQGALLPNLVSKEELVAANSLSNLTQQMAQVLGPAIGGVLVAIPAVGIAGVSFLNAASFAAGVVGLALMRLPAHLNGARAGNGSFWHELVDGFRYLSKLRVLVIILFMAMILNFTIGPFQVLLPVLVRNVLGQGSAGLGVLMSFLGVGMVAGSIVIGAWSPTRHRGWLTFGLIAVGGSLYALIGVIPIFVLVVGLLAVFGALIAMVNTMLTAVMQALIADEYRGRVFSLDMMISTGLMPISLAIGGGLGDAMGPGMVITLAGALTAVVALGGLAVREIRELE